MRWSAFRKWNEHHANPVNLDELASVFRNMRAEISEYSFNTMLESKVFNDNRVMTWTDASATNWCSLLNCQTLLMMNAQMWV